MTDEQRMDRDRSITWVVDATAPYCFVTDPDVMAEFEATLNILQAECTVGEFVDRMAAHDPDVLLSIFGTESVDEIHQMSEDGDIAELDAPWSPDGISSYDLIPSNARFFSSLYSPAVLEDLFEDEDIYGEFESLAFEHHATVIERLRKVEIPFVERPGAVFRLVASVRGGDRR